MSVSRRFFSIGLASSLAACSQGGGGNRFVAFAGPADAPPQRPSRSEPALPTTGNAGYDAWVKGFRARALGAGISVSTFDRAFRDSGYTPGVIERDNNQVEVRRTLEDYLAIAASEARISGGRDALSQNRSLLNDIEARYGVQSEVLVAIWGMESSFGSRRGSTPVISALSTLAYNSRRASFFEKQLISALRILQNGDISPERMTGSWAGAMGHTQFIPTTYEGFAVDYRGDGRRDIWSDDPTDALASAANYLAKSGWQAGKLWGVEVRLPNGSDALATRSVAEWRARGVTLATGGTVPDHGAGTLILPNGAGGPAFLLFRNYKVLRTYNNSLKYAVGIGHLSDRIAGGGPFKGSFGPDANGLTLSERKEVQDRLTRAGFDTDGADGVVGDKTTAAIQGYEAAKGLPVTGIATKALLLHLRS